MAYTPAQQANIKRYAALNPAARAQANDYFWKLSGRPMQLEPHLQASIANQQAAAQSAYARQVGENTYQQGQTRAQYGTRISDLTHQYDQMRQQMPYADVQRGVLGSGIWQHQLGQYGYNRASAFHNLYQQRAGALGNLQQARQNIEAQRAQALAQIQAQRQMYLSQQAMAQAMNSQVPQSY